MGIAELLTPDRVVCDVGVGSKKRVLELLSSLMADVAPGLTEREIFNGLLARERLGSTGLGKGIAIPHGRFEHVDSAVGAVIKLTKGVDFDSVDGESVDLVFALMVPKEATDEHLQLLASLAEMFSSAEFLTQLREAASPDAVIAIFHQSMP